MRLFYMNKKTYKNNQKVRLLYNNHKVLGTITDTIVVVNEDLSVCVQIKVLTEQITLVLTPEELYSLESEAKNYEHYSCGW